MSTITIKYRLSNDAIRRITVETGDKPGIDQALTVELRDLSPEQRQALIDAKIVGQYLTEIECKSWVDGSHYTNAAKFDSALGVEQVIDYLATLPAQLAAADQRREEMKAAHNRDLAAKARELIADGQSSTLGGILYNVRIYEDVEGATEAHAAIEAAKAKYAELLRKYRL